MKRALDLDGGPRRLLARLSRELDDAYADAYEVVADEPGLLAADRAHERFKVPPLEAEPLPASTELLRDRIAALIPTSELPEVLLEVDAWTGFTRAFLPATGTTRSPDRAGTSAADSDRERLSPLQRELPPSGLRGPHTRATRARRCSC